jgi:hypothetical protein
MYQASQMEMQAAMTVDNIQALANEWATHWE